MMSIELFPYIFGRIGGASFDNNYKLEDAVIIQLVKKLESEELHSNKLRQQLMDILYEKIATSSSTKEQNELLNLKRDIHNQRSVEKQIGKDIILHSLELSRLVKEYSQQQLIIENIESEIEISHNQTVTSEIRALGSMANEFFLSNGLLFSSDSVPIGVFDFIGKPYSSLNKKERKMVFTMLRYLSRSTAKTTPFSSFNATFLLKQEGDDFYPVKLEKSVSKISINNLVYLIVINTLQAVFSVKKTFHVFVNPSIRFVDGAINYFHNQDNNEAFFNTQNAPIIQFIIDFLSTDNIITYNDLLHEIIRVSGEDIENVKSYTEQLIQQGIVIVQPPVLIKDRNWAVKLSSYLKKLIHDDDCREVVTVLVNILDSAISSATLLESIFDVKEREGICHGVYNRFLSDMDKIKDMTAGIEISKIMEQLSPSMLFYEDTYTDDIAGANFEKQRSRISKLGKLYGFIDGKYGRKTVLRTAIKQQLKALYPDGKAPLLSFYSDIYLKHKVSEKVMVSYGQDLCQELESLMCFLKNNDPDELYIDEWLNCSGMAESEIPSFGLFLQICNDTFIVNNLTSGIASNISRFIDFYASSPIVSEIRSKILEVYGDSIVAELTDASIHNTNTFAGLVDVVIDVSQKKSSQQKNINLKDLFICVDNNEQVILQNERGERVVPIDFSMESINRRSALMRFIDIFSDFNSEGLSLLLQVIDQSVIANKLQTESIILIPRVYYSGVVLSRKRWLVSINFLNDLFPSNKQEAIQFVKFNNWRKENGIPDHIFVKQGMVYTGNKPQYLNLKSPLYFQLLKNSIANMKTDFVELSEMLPTPEQLYRKSDGYSYVTEYILNITNSENNNGNDK